MPAAANLTILSPKPGEPAVAAIPGGAELFAALVAGVTATPVTAGDAPAGDDADGASERTVDTTEPNNGAAVIDASVLLPLIEQQRAAVPAPVEELAAPRRSGEAKAAAVAAAPLSHAGTVSKVNPAGVGAPLESSPTIKSPASRLLEASIPTGQPAVSEPAKHAVAPATAVERALSDPPSPSKLASDRGVAKVSAPGAPGPAVREVSDPAASIVSEVRAKVASVAPDGAAAGHLAVAPGSTATEGKVNTRLVATESADPKIVIPAQAGTQLSSLAAKAGLGSRLRGNDKGGSGPAKGSSDGFAPVDASLKSVVADVGGKPAKLEAGSPTGRAAKTEAEAVSVQAFPTGDRPVVSSTQALGTPLQATVQASAVAVAAVPVASAIAAQVLDMSRGGAWIDELARDISKAASSEGSMRFRLAPETLGELRVEITQGERGAHVKLHVTSEVAQQALADAQPKLAAEARAQGVRIAETEISFSGGQGDGRDAGRQAQAQPQADQPLRALRGGAGNANRTDISEAGAPTGRRSHDRYA